MSLFAKPRPPEPEPFDPDRLRTELMQMRENLTPIIESAEGQRRELVNNGWTPDAAEKIALMYVGAAFAALFGGAS